MGSTRHIISSSYFDDQDSLSSSSEVQEKNVLASNDTNANSIQPKCRIYIDDLSVWLADIDSQIYACLGSMFKPQKNIILECMDNFIRKLTADYDKLVKPKIAQRLSSYIRNYINVCRYLYQPFETGKRYYKRLVKILAIYTDLELCASIRGTEYDTIIAERIQLNYRTHLQNAENHIVLDVFVQMKRFWRRHRGILNLLLKFFLIRRDTVVLSDNQFIKHLIVYKKWLYMEEILDDRKVIYKAFERLVKPKDTLCKNAFYTAYLPLDDLGMVTTKNFAQMLHMNYSVSALLRSLKRAEDTIEANMRNVCIIVSDDDEEQTSTNTNKNNWMSDHHESSNEAEITIFSENMSQVIPHELEHSTDLSLSQPSELNEIPSHAYQNQNGCLNRLLQSPISEDMDIEKSVETRLYMFPCRPSGEQFAVDTKSINAVENQLTEETPSQLASFNNEALTKSTDQNQNESCREPSETVVRTEGTPYVEDYSIDRPFNQYGSFLDRIWAKTRFPYRNDSHRRFFGTPLNAAPDVDIQPPTSTVEHVNHEKTIPETSSNNILTTFRASAFVPHVDHNGSHSSENHVENDKDKTMPTTTSNISELGKPFKVWHRLYMEQNAQIVENNLESNDQTRNYETCDRLPVTEDTAIMQDNIATDRSLNNIYSLNSCTGLEALSLNYSKDTSSPLRTPSPSFAFNVEGSLSVYTNKNKYKPISYEEERSKFNENSDSVSENKLNNGTSSADDLIQDPYQLPAKTLDSIDTNLLSPPEFRNDILVYEDDIASWIADAASPIPALQPAPSPTISLVLNAEESPSVYTNKNAAKPRSEAKDQTQFEKPEIIVIPSTSNDSNVLAQEPSLPIENNIADPYQLSTEKDALVDTTVLPPPELGAEIILEDIDASSLILDLFPWTNDSVQTGKGRKHKKSSLAKGKHSKPQKEPSTSNFQPSDTSSGIQQPERLLEIMKIESESDVSVRGSLNKDEQDSFLDDIFGGNELRTDLPPKSKNNTLNTSQTSSVTPIPSKFNINSRHDFKSISKSAYTPPANFLKAMASTPIDRQRLNGTPIQREGMYSTSPSVPIKITYTTKTMNRLNGSLKLVTSPVESTIVKRQNYVKPALMSQINRTENTTKFSEGVRNDKNSSIISSFSYIGKPSHMGGPNGTNTFYKATDKSPATILERKDYVKGGKVNTLVPKPKKLTPSIRPTRRLSKMMTAVEGPSSSPQMPRPIKEDLSEQDQTLSENTVADDMPQNSVANLNENNNSQGPNATPGLSTKVKLLTKKCVVACDTKTIVDYCRKKNLSLASLTSGISDDVANDDNAGQSPPEVMESNAVEHVQTHVPFIETIKEEIVEKTRRLSQVTVSETGDNEEEDLLFTPFKKKTKFATDMTETTFEFSDIFNNFDNSMLGTPNPVSTSRILNALGDTLASSTPENSTSMTSGFRDILPITAQNISTISMKAFEGSLASFAQTKPSTIVSTYGEPLPTSTIRYSSKDLSGFGRFTNPTILESSERAHSTLEDTFNSSTFDSSYESANNSYTRKSNRSRKRPKKLDL